MIAKVSNKKDNVFIKYSLAKFWWELIVSSLLSFYIDIGCILELSCKIVMLSWTQNKTSILRMGNWIDATFCKVLSTFYL